MLRRWGIDTKFIAANFSNAASALTARSKMLLGRKPRHPLNRLVPFPQAAAFAQTNKLISVIDATLGPPPLQQPLKQGFDLEVHSATKYFGGHSDLLAGVVVGSRETVAKLRAAHRVFGAVLDARAAAELWRGLETLELRVRHISASTLELAQRLEKHPRISKVHYPSLRSHPDCALAQSQMNGCGGLLSFDLGENSEAAARRCVENMKLFRHAPSLGGVESLVSYPPLSSHANQSDELLARAGITRGTLRLSVGLENVELLWRDLENALS
jgi:cystathionine beta-lyase/cystathionine gamma-synthase